MMTSECKYLPQVDYTTCKASGWVFLHIFHRLPKVAGGPAAVQRGDKLFYILQETRRFHACTQTHARGLEPPLQNQCGSPCDGCCF